MKFRAILLLTLSVVGTLSAQGKVRAPYASKVHIGVAGGICFATRNLFIGAKTDHLLAYDRVLSYYQMGPLTYFFRRHWGVTLKVQLASSKNMRGRADRFIAQETTEYEAAYYVSASTSAKTPYDLASTGSVQYGHIGLTYRYENARYFIYPTLSVGWISFNLDNATTRLKEPNAHTITRIVYAPEGFFWEERFTITPSVMLGFKLSKYVWLHLDASTICYRPDFTYSQITTNLVTGESSPAIHYRYNRFMIDGSVGIGAMLAF